MTNINNINNTITTNDQAIATTIAYDYNYQTPAADQNEQYNPEQDINTL